MSPAAVSRSRVPTLRQERRLLREGHLLVAGMDEVGRGALAGPVTVGVVVVDAAVRTAPAGVRDSKLLTPAARVALVPRLRRWAVAWAIGHAEPEEIDLYGIIAALRLAGRRALASLPDLPSGVLLDGSHDWLSLPHPPPRPARPSRRALVTDLAPSDDLALIDDLALVDDCARSDEPALFEVPAEALPPRPSSRRAAPVVPLRPEPQVVTLVKADLRCAAVAAASVLAKVERDAIMVERSAAYPAYGWQGNKGYSAPEHLAALLASGPCDQHRRTWSLPGIAPGPAGRGGGSADGRGLRHDGSAHDCGAASAVPPVRTPCPPYGPQPPGATSPR